MSTNNPAKKATPRAVTGSMRFALACLGEPLFEFNQTRADGDYRPGFGGDVSNCAIAAARQGARVAMITAVGCDSFGDRFLDLWRNEGIDTGAVRRDPAAPTGLYFITHGPEGHRFDYRRAGSAASRLGPDGLDDAVLMASAFLHVSAISQAIGPVAADAVFAAIETVRAAGGRVAAVGRRGGRHPARERARGGGTKA